MAPLDLTFDADNRTRTVVQPNVFIMCRNYLRENRIVGTPLLIVEVISPSTAANDTIRKVMLYQGVGGPGVLDRGTRRSDS